MNYLKTDEYNTARLAAFLICAFFLPLILLCASCGKAGSEADAIYEETQTAAMDEMAPLAESAEQTLFPQQYAVDSQEAEEIQRQCREIALLCHDRMAYGETETSSYYPYDTTLTRAAVDAVETLLAEAGYPVLNSDEKYPEYLENAEGLKGFLAAAEKGGSCQQSIISVSSYHATYCVTFQYTGSIMYCINAIIIWDEDDTFTISEPYKMEIMDWGTTYNGYFYYQIYPLNRHWDACSSIRLEAPDKELYDLYAKYAAPIGYPSCIFTLDWDSCHYENVCFNDLFDVLYEARYDEQASCEDYEYDEAGQCYCIPADIFEDTLLPYFDIPLDVFRTSALYTSESNAYPWQPLDSSNIIYCPTLTPVVTECRDNEDGTFTIVVDVLCFDYKYFPYFTHEITVQPGIGGEFQYIANQVTYACEQGVPDTTPRLTA